MSIHAAKRLLVGQWLFPATNWLLNRKGIRRNYRALLQTDTASEALLADLQLHRVRRVLAHARRWCPFYAERLRDAGIDPQHIRNLEDLRNIPPLSRVDLMDHRNELVDRRLQAALAAANRQQRPPGQPIPFAAFRQERLVRNTSTGSTGEPVVFYEDGSTTARSWSHELRLKHWFGLAPGEREARFARVSTEYVARSKALRARRLLWNQLVLPGMNLAKEDYASCLDALRTFRPRILFGITTALTGFARYLNGLGAKCEEVAPQLVITWAAPLYDHERALLEETFGCRASNIYGSREVGHVASRCPAGGLHVHQEDYYVEIEHDAAHSDAHGAGQILITPLFPTPMPLVRYRIGDVGTLAGSHCLCGRKHVLLGDLLGRTAEVFVTRQGRVIPPNFWCRAFMGDAGSDHVEQFQVVLESDDAIRFRVVRRPNYSERTEGDLRSYLFAQLDNELSLTFEYVAHIPAQPSGKYQMVVDRRSPSYVPYRCATSAP